MHVYRYALKRRGFVHVMGQKNSTWEKTFEKFRVLVKPSRKAGLCHWALRFGAAGAIAGTFSQGAYFKTAQAAEIFMSYQTEYYSISTSFANYSALALAGFGAEYVTPLTNYLHVRGVGSISIDLANTSPVFIDGGGGLALSLVGGAPLNLTNADMTFEAAPHQHIFTYLDFVNRLYDVTNTVPPPVQEKTGERRKVTRIGTYISPKAGLGYDFYLNPKGFATVGIRLWGTQSLNLSDLSISSFGASVTLGYQFNDDFLMRFFQGG